MNSAGVMSFSDGGSGKFRPGGDGPVMIQHDSRGQTRGNSGETSASPSFSVSSGNGGEVTPPRSAKVASSPTQRAEKTRRARAVALPLAPCSVR